MQSLTNITLKTVVQKQVKWKAKLYLSALITLITLQLLFGLLLFDSGSGSSGYGRGNLDVQFSIYSLDLFLMIAAFWAFISATLFTTKAFRIDDLSIISSRTSCAIANMIVIIFYSLIAVIIMVSSLYLQLVAVLLWSNETLIVDQLIVSPTILMVCFSIICLFGAIGLLLGNCYKGPATVKVCTTIFLVIGILLFNLSSQSISLAGFILLPNIIVSLIILSVAALCFALAIWIASKSEVSRL
ncbi:hypothetical protein AEA09_01270 [Lysinibacillus contaminans]|uniref:ABC transporter permease n=1 Tax=Lysinibacillus contaminans TaxID=1293441 RepID=A0ABR5K5T3_9BACI|nr:hypothetical protein [Lysinibacillus contaminans]KOS71649.1 hypothetical protein AEA09_01270 [Lysinibacillus contaminans]